MYHVVRMAIVVVENSTYFLGTYMFGSMLGPLVDTFLNSYITEVPFHSPFLGMQDTYDTFLFDYRNTKSPDIKNGYVDFYFLGDVTPKDRPNLCDIEADKMQFLNTEIIS